MAGFLDEVRCAQKQQQAKQKTPQQVYAQLHQMELDSSLRYIKNRIITDAKSNPANKNLKGRIPFGGTHSTARIDQTPDVKTAYYIINRNCLPGDDYRDYCTGNTYTWMSTAKLYEVEDNLGFFGTTCRITLTKRGKVFLEELKKMCAAEKITVKFSVCAKWYHAGHRQTGEAFAELDREFKFKGQLTSAFLMVDYAVKL